MKILIQTIIMILAGIALAIFVKDNPGYVLFSYGSYTAETSLAIFVVLSVIVIFGSYLLIRFISSLIYAPSRIRKWQDQRAERIASTALTRGLLAQAEGNWKQSEKALLTYAKKTDSAINYLAAAKSAQAQGANHRMNQYLDMAQATDPSASVAIRLTQAELLIDSGQTERAAAALLRIRQDYPRNSRALLLMIKLYKQTANWDKLQDLLFDIRRNRVLTTEACDDLEKQVYSGLLAKACESDNLLTIQNTWASFPKHLQRSPELIAIYTRKLIEEGEFNQAEPILRNSVRTQFNDDLIYLYGLLYTNAPYRELRVAEKWYKQSPSNPTLLLTLGRLSSRSELWGKARSYLESSIENGGGPEAYHALAQVLEHIDEHELAASMYRKGLELASGKGLPELAALNAKKKTNPEKPGNETELEDSSAEPKKLENANEDSSKQQSVMATA